MDDTALYAAIGEEGFTRLVAAFYRRIKTDDLIGPMYPPEDMEGGEIRLRDFLIYRFGGPDRYTTVRGHPRLRQRHMPFPVDEAAVDRWLALMQDAGKETGLIQSPAWPALWKFFVGTAMFMQNKG